LAVDTIEGSAWVSIAPFQVEHFRVLGLPVPPPASGFSETNVRTYVRAPDGRDGLWFLSLDVSSVVNVGGGGSLGLPYPPVDHVGTRRPASALLVAAHRRGPRPP
jgi:hypothetical protein